MDSKLWLLAYPKLCRPILHALLQIVSIILLQLDYNMSIVCFSVIFHYLNVLFVKKKSFFSTEKTLEPPWNGTWSWAGFGVWNWCSNISSWTCFIRNSLCYISQGSVQIRCLQSRWPAGGYRKCWCINQGKHILIYLVNEFPALTLFHFCADSGCR